MKKKIIKLIKIYNKKIIKIDILILKIKKTKNQFLIIKIKIKKIKKIEKK